MHATVQLQSANPLTYGHPRISVPSMQIIDSSDTVQYMCVIYTLHTIHFL